MVCADLGRVCLQPLGYLWEVCGHRVRGADIFQEMLQQQQLFLIQGSYVRDACRTCAIHLTVPWVSGCGFILIELGGDCTYFLGVWPCLWILITPRAQREGVMWSVVVSICTHKNFEMFSKHFLFELNCATSSRDDPFQHSRRNLAAFTCQTCSQAGLLAPLLQPTCNSFYTKRNRLRPLT